MNRRLFALDQNFPEPIVNALRDAVVEAELVPVRQIDERLPRFDDWKLLLALHHHERPWEGLITTDSSMLALPRELAVLHQTRLTVVVAKKAGNDPLRATGLVLTHLPQICKVTDRKKAQVWVLNATSKNPEKAWEFLARIAERKGLKAPDYFQEHRLAEDALAENPLR